MCIMRDDDTKQSNSVNRRRFIQSAASVGVSGTVLSNVFGKASADVQDHTSQVRILKGHEYTNLKEIDKHNAAPVKEPVYSTIPRERWSRIVASFEARQRIQQQVDQITDLNIDVQVSTTEKNGKKQKRIVVPYPVTEYPDGTVASPKIEYEDLKNSINREVTGVAAQGTSHERKLENIPVSIEKGQEQLEVHFNSKYRPVPAGCQLQRLPRNKACTIGMPKYSRSDNRWQFVTAGHCIRDNSDRKIHQPRNGGVNGSRIGTRLRYRNASDFDAGIISRRNGINKIMQLAKDDSLGYKYPIRGTMSKSWLQNLDDRSGYITFQGRTSGVVGGTVDRVGDTTFRTSSQSDGGDSGGPYYYIEGDGDAWVGGIHRGSFGSQTIATIMVSIENYYNLA